MSSKMKKIDKDDFINLSIDVESLTTNNNNNFQRTNSSSVNNKRKLKSNITPKKHKNHPKHHLLSNSNTNLNSDSKNDLKHINPNEISIELLSALNESSHTSLTNSSLASLNDLNEEMDNKTGKSDMLSQLPNNHHINEILNRLNEQARLMTVNLKCSDTYKDVVNSLLKERLISYAKQYDTYLDPNDIKKIEHDERESLCRHQIRFEKRNIKQKKLMSNVNLVRSITKLNRLGHEGSSKSSFNAEVETDSSKIEYTQRKVKQTISINHLPTNTNTQNTSRSSQSSASNYVNRKTSSKASGEMKKSESTSANKNLKTNEPKKVPREVAPQIRLTDLILKGYEYSKNSNECKDDSFDENSDDLIQRKPKTLVVEPIDYLTPSFKIKRFNITDIKQLEQAKQDLYRRYSFINDANLLTKTTMPFSLNVKSKVPTVHLQQLIKI